MSSWRERLVEGTREAVERRTGYTLTQVERLGYLEESDQERRLLQRELDLLAYTALNYVGGAPQELKPNERRRMVQRARVVWMKDPQAGASVDLMNDFVWGKGLNKPKANDPAVQEVIDEAWDDPDNQLVLTDYFAQLALGTDFELQSNLFFLVFEDGEDGKVKLGLLNHDSVETVVRDEDNRLRIMYYVARHWQLKWDFQNDQPMMLTQPIQPTSNSKMPGSALPVRQSGQPIVGEGVMRYYEHWRNVEDAAEDAESGARDMPDLCPDNKLGDGKVYHVAMNRGTEMAFGHPRMDRLIRWYNAYNNFMDARVDIMAASAAFVMKRKVQGTPAQLQKMANQALSRRSALAMGRDPVVGAEVGPKAASILTENESVSHEDFNISTNAPQAAQDAQMLRAQISAATRWPQSYYGDASQSNLATATSLELPVLKAVQARQTMFESVVRFFTDRVIERAVEAGRLSADLTDDEVAAQKSGPDVDTSLEPSALEPGEAVPKPTTKPTTSSSNGNTPTTASQQAYQDEGQDEEATARDLGYDFQMPNPLDRLLGDVVTAVTTIAQTFDPQQSNTELLRTLLAIVLTELGIEDAAATVERIYPPGYIAPATAAAAGPGGPDSSPAMNPGADQGEFSSSAMTGAMGDDTQNQYGGGYAGGNPYGAVASSQSPEQVAESRHDPAFQERMAARVAQIDSMLDDSVLDALATVSNGNGSHDG